MIVLKVICKVQRKFLKIKIIKIHKKNYLKLKILFKIWINKQYNKKYLLFLNNNKKINKFSENKIQIKLKNKMKIIGQIFKFSKVKIFNK